MGYYKLKIPGAKVEILFHWQTYMAGVIVPLILTHLAYRAHAKKCDISNNNSMF